VGVKLAEIPVFRHFASNLLKAKLNAMSESLTENRNLAAPPDPMATQILFLIFRSSPFAH